MTDFLLIQNRSRTALKDLPEFSMADFKNRICGRVKAGDSIAALFAVPENEKFRLYCVLRGHNPGTLSVATAVLEEKEYAALTPSCTQAHMFEREIWEQYGIIPKGHPCLKPVRFEKSRADQTAKLPDAPVLPDEYRVEGDSVHEVAVGPVHAGVIEPGHFRFQCGGETVHHLEISLGYQHRGIEKRLCTAGRKALHYAETLSGDSTVAHATAWCRLAEALTDTTVPARAEAIRAVAMELERVANHVGDLGALAGDVAFLPTASYCGRIRGEYLNMTAEICGNRFGRNLVREGGVAYDITEAQAQKLLGWIDRVYPDTVNALELMLDAPTVLDRLENTGTVSHWDALEIGLAGMAARACGIRSDIRRDLPSGYYKTLAPHLATEQDGDVLARAKIRYGEIRESIAFIRMVLGNLPQGGIREWDEAKTFAPDSLSIALEEAWRGEVCHIMLTDTGGAPAYCKIVDPSFHNWFGLALALRGEEISDFPICNKSFNLSYCGHDL